MKMEVFLDSGAWSAYTQNDPIDIDNYIRFVERNEHLLFAYANLDVVSDGRRSYQNYLYMKDAGLSPVPVYHSGTDIKYLKHYLEDADYIAIGAIANMTTSKRIADLDRLWVEYLVDDELMPVKKIHGFGLTSLRIMFRYPWYSVDSTSWVTFSRFGTILIPDVFKGEYVYNRPPRPICVSVRSPSNKKEFQNFNGFNESKRNKVIEYVNSKGFEIGESEMVDGKEKIIEPGLMNDHKLRDQFNFLFYVEAEQRLEWPRPLNIQKYQTRLL